MATRVTQQFLQYVGEPASADQSKLRVTSVYAQVLISSGIVSRTCSNTIFADADDNKVEMANFFYFDATNTFFSDPADNDAIYDPVYNEFVSQSLFNGTDTVEALYRECSNVMFGDADDNKASPDAYIEIVQYLGWTDRKIFDIGNSLRWSGVVTEAVVVSAANFFFTDPDSNNRVDQAHLVSNSLGWIDVLAASAEGNAENNLGFVDAWTFTGTIFDRNITQDGGGFFKQTVSVEVSDNTCREHEYDPLIGATDDDTYEPFRVTPPIFTEGTVVLSYPTTSPTTTLTLDHPDFNDGDTLHFTRIDRKTRGGARKIYSDTKWASWERLEQTYSDLVDPTCSGTEIDAETIIDFLNTTLGKRIRLTDWEGRTWEGFINDVETEIVNRGDRGWRFDLVFEGVDVSSFVEHDELIVTHNVNPGDDIIVTHDL